LFAAKPFPSVGADQDGRGNRNRPDRFRAIRSIANLSGLPRPSQKFSNLFNAYAKAFNKRYNRTGSLFQRPFGRVKVTSDAQLFHLAIYIHRNPERHGLVEDFRYWPYSSYRALVSGAGESHLKQAEVMSWFGNISNFEQAHQADVELERIARFGKVDVD
jgi:hypothetical protein